MIRRRSLRLGLHAAMVVGVVGVVGVSLIAAAAPPGRPAIDPRQMSGIPRVDPEVPAGAITVRCLLGAFDRPAVDVTVQLILRSADSARNEVMSAKTDAEGRATFTELGGWIGGTAIASAELAGETLRSQAIPIAASAGSRVMLVAGAEAGAAADGAASAGARPDMPLPGRPFADPRFPRGTIVVGALDMGARQGIADVPVRLEIQPPAGEVIERSGRTDAEGRALFEGLAPPDVPEDSTLTIEARLDPSAPPQRSEPFKLGEVGMALVFTIGTAAARGQDAFAPPERRRVTPPRATPTVAPGSVRVAVIDGADRPVGDQPVTVIQRSVTGASAKYSGRTGADGVALVDGVEVEGESAYAVEVIYRGAPYRTSLFTMSDTLGVTAELRVFPTTSDPSRIRGATQLEVIGRENDLAQVTQLYQLFVSGDEAFWPAEPLRLAGADGAIGFVVMDRATADLQHDAQAPFATLAEPIPPGEIVDMSFAYLVEHDGSADIRWSPPLPLVDVSVVVPRPLQLTRGAKGPPKPPPNAPPEAEYDYYALGEYDAGSHFDLEVSGLPVRPHLFKDLGWALGLGILAAIGVGLWFADRRSPQERLAARKVELLAELDRADAALAAGKADAGVERQRILGELDHVFRLLDAHAHAKAAPGAARA